MITKIKILAPMVRNAEPVYTCRIMSDKPGTTTDILQKLVTTAYHDFEDLEPQDIKIFIHDDTTNDGDGLGIEFVPSWGADLSSYRK